MSAEASLIAARLAFLCHFAFVAFVVLGGLLLLHRVQWAVLHLPALVWALLVECAGFECPLTRLEQHFWRGAGTGGYEGGFIEHYLVPILYPVGLTREQQVVLGLIALVANLVPYALALHRARRRNTAAQPRSP